MFYGAKSGSVPIGDTWMHYVTFGQGEQPLIMLPGLSDGLKTVEGQALQLAFYFRDYLKDFKVYVFSRKEKMSPGYTTKGMSRDLRIALEYLGMDRVFLMGVSQGGMIAQQFTLDYPGSVEKLVLAVSTSRATDTLREVVNTWITYGENSDYSALMTDTLEKSYSPAKLKSYRLLLPLLTRMGKPKNFDRFLIQARAVLTHHTYEQLEEITCPTLIVGGDSDNVVGSEASPEMAEKIPNSWLILYEGLGHASYEESKTFNQQVKDFLLD